MNRNEKMVAMFVVIAAEMEHYTDGLTLDYECLNSVMDILAPVYMELNTCCICGAGDKEMGTAVKHPTEDCYAPCCKDCHRENHAQYLCVWGVGYINHDDLNAAKQEVNSFSFFRAECGYTSEMITQIIGLALGESVTFFDGPMASTHSVIRIR